MFFVHLITVSASERPKKINVVFLLHISEGNIQHFYRTASVKVVKFANRTYKKLLSDMFYYQFNNSGRKCFTFHLYCSNNNIIFTNDLNIWQVHENIITCRLLLSILCSDGGKFTLLYWLLYSCQPAQPKHVMGKFTQHFLFFFI